MASQKNLAPASTRQPGISVADVLTGTPHSTPIMGQLANTNGDTLAAGSDNDGDYTLGEGVDPTYCFFLRTDLAQPDDAHRDGRFGLSGLVSAVQARRFPPGEATMWAQSGWNVDGLFDTTDLVRACQRSVYAAP